jgi:N-acetylglucosaminyldiphosphoundecaprenol N-acetyl-beta-D-mannosaminyltransferase
MALTTATVHPAAPARPQALHHPVPERRIAPRSWQRIEIGGLPIDNLTMEGALDAMMERLATGTRTRLYFVNADCVNVGQRDPEYRSAVRHGDLVFADGSGMRLAGRILGTPVADNVNGTDFFPRACERLAGGGHRVFLLGGRPGVARKVRQWVRANHPGLEICGTHHGYFDRTQSHAIAARIRRSGADVLLVAFGAPAQEKWIAANFELSGVTVALGEGGLFDFFSGEMPRAPLWMRRAGVEWIYRFWREPRRLWKRYWVGNFVFTARMLREVGTRQHGARLALDRGAQ